MIGLGALNIDLIATKSDEDEVEDGETLTTLDEIQGRLKKEDLRPDHFLGGSAFNAIAMLAGLELELRLGMAGISTSARYGMAESHTDRLESLDIADLTQPSELQPGHCLACCTGRFRSLRTAPEANLEIVDLLRHSEALRTAASSAGMLHLTSLLEDPTLPGSTEIVSAVASFVEEVKHANPALRLSFDPGAMWVDGLAHLPDLRRVYALTDLLFINLQEREVLNTATHGGSYDKRSVHGLCRAGAFVVVKLLDRVIVQSADGPELACVPRSDDAQAVDPTGAGDAVAAGVLAALGAGRSVVEGCELGLRIAALRVSDHGDRGHVDLPGGLGIVWPPEPSSVDPALWRRMVAETSLT